MRRSDRVRSGRGRFRAVSLAVLVSCLTFGAAQALADAPNPIPGTTFATVVHNAPGTPTGTWTVYVKGEWNWLSHNADCNLNRSAAGLAIAWNDPNEPGYTISQNAGNGNGTIAPMSNTVTAFNAPTAPTVGEAVSGKNIPANTFITSVSGSAHNFTLGLSNTTTNTTTVSEGLQLTVTASVGVSAKNNGDTLNQIDGQVHPADVGQKGPPASEMAPGVTTAGGFAANQQFNDPAPVAAGGTHPVSTWKGGCGGEPFGGSWDPYTSKGQPEPFGSWGYDKNLPGGGDSANGGGLGYSHTYEKRSDITKICVNFYDPHGGDQPGHSNFQVPGGNNDLDVVGNNDNSIQTNSFNVNGESCVSVATISTSASNQTAATAAPAVGGSISDTASIKGGSPNSSPTVTFRAYLQDNGQAANGTANGDGNGTPGAPVCTTPAFTDTEPVTLDSNGDGSVGSAPFSHSPYLTPGTYEWIATLNPAGTQNASVSNLCGDSGEQSVVAHHPSTMTTGQKFSIHDVASISNFVSGGTGGTVDFQLFNNATCSGTPLFDSGARPVDTSNGTANSGTSAKPDFNVPFTNTNTTYNWLVSYSGDANNGFSKSTCGTEHFSVAGNNLPSGVDP